MADLWRKNYHHQRGTRGHFAAAGYATDRSGGQPRAAYQLSLSLCATQRGRRERGPHALLSRLAAEHPGGDGPDAAARRAGCTGGAFAALATLRRACLRPCPVQHALFPDRRAPALPAQRARISAPVEWLCPP